MAKIRFYAVAALMICIFLLLITLRSTLFRSSSSLGRLVFTDFPKPNYNYAVDVFDIERNKRTSLPLTSYQNIGTQAIIDEQYVYSSMCFLPYVSVLCPAYVSGIFSSKEVHRFDNVKQFWKKNYGSPVWSPDGSHIAFIVLNKGTENNQLYSADIHVMNADGTDILDPAPSENGFHFVWSPNSKQIAFACSNRQYLCIVNADGSQLQRLNALINTNVSDIAWSPDGNQIVFTLSAKDFHNAELYLVNTDGSNMHRLLATQSGHHEYPVWSPDGSKIAFRSGDQNNSGDIYVIKSDGTNLRNLSQSLNGNDFGAVWSPDSTKIAFFSNQYQKGTYVYIVNADGENLQQITENSTSALMDAPGPELFWLP